MSKVKKPVLSLSKDQQSNVLLGAHVSASGGIINALTEAQELDCGVIQIFTTNSNRWQGKKISEGEIKDFLKRKKELNIEVVSHDSYLINLASPNIELRIKSIKAFKDEILRCQSLEIKYLVMHPGSHVGVGEGVGLKNIIDSLNDVLKNDKSEVKIILETTAGQGSNLGYKFEQLAEIRNGIAKKERIGFCLDTCHIFTAGYDLRSVEKYDKVINEFERVLGLKNLYVIHLNDSKKDLGTKVDRHENIGKGFLGKEVFGFILNDKRLEKVYKILETPAGEGEVDGRALDLKVLKSLIL
jgi:deoxyribonuclease-4